MRDGTSVWYSEKHKRWIFQVAFRDSSGQRRTIQRRARTKSEAERRAIDLSRSPQLKEVKLGVVNLDALLAKYIAEQKLRVRPASLANSVHLLNLYVLPMWGRRNISNITQNMIEELLVELEGSGLRVGTVNTVRAKLHALLNFAVRKGHLVSNPVSQVRPLAYSAGKASQVQPPWSISEAKAALAAFKGHELEPFVVLALATGMRKGEILALRWSDVNFSSLTIRIQRSRGERRVLSATSKLEVKILEGLTKTKASNRTLPMSAEVASLLSDLKIRRFGAHEGGEDGYLILGMHGNPISPSCLTRSFNKVLVEAGIRRIRIHDMRHTAANLALETGARLEELSQGLGHTGTEITKRTYAPAVQALSDRFVSGVSRALFD